MNNIIVRLLTCSAILCLFFAQKCTAEQINEDDMRSRLEDETGQVIVSWVYDDYDGDGLFEAFASTLAGEEVGDELHSIWFINNHGITEVDTGYVRLGEQMRMRNYVFQEVFGRHWNDMYGIRDGEVILVKTPEDIIIDQIYEDDTGKVYGVEWGWYNEERMFTYHRLAFDPDNMEFIDMHESYVEYQNQEMTAMRSRTISAGVEHSLAIRNDGTVIAGGWSEYDQNEVEGWSDIVSVAAGTFHSVGLRSDGSVVAIGSNLQGQCNVEDWNNIVAIAAAPFATYGVRNDGTVVATGSNEYGQCNVETWMDIIDISASSDHALGLRRDGTVVAVGSNENGECEVGSWHDIIEISADIYQSVGLTADGRVLSIGDNSCGQCETTQFSNVKHAYAAGFSTVVITQDGRVMGIGDSFNYSYAIGYDMLELENIEVISISVEYFVALTSDGRIIARGEDYAGQCMLDGECDIRLP